jgi:cobalt-zinc-cadmium efflux system membrane fusion protein
MTGKYLGAAVAVILAGAILAAVILLRPRATEAPSAATGAGRPAKAEPQRQELSNLEKIVRLSDEQLKEFGVETGVARPGRLRIEVTLPGEISLNADRVAHVVPRVSGVVREVHKNLGDTVRRGDIMAVLESRDLADSTAALLAARERVTLARSNFTREEALWQKKITPEQDYIGAKNALAEAEIGLRTAEQKLRALGFSDEYIARLSAQQSKDAIRYEMLAPFDATVIEKHISLGEVLKDDTSAFLIADLSSVWVNLDVQQKDLPYIRTGQTAVISAVQAVPDVQGLVSFLEPMALETSRTIHARVVIPNRDGRWRPGMFVSGRIAVDDILVPVLAPDGALLMVEGKVCVFVRAGEGFKLQSVTTGRTDGIHTEIKDGLMPGQAYVIRGAFTLKSELEKPEAER